jgi:hypothetical protein
MLISMRAVSDSDLMPVSSFRGDAGCDRSKATRGAVINRVRVSGCPLTRYPGATPGSSRICVGCSESEPHNLAASARRPFLEKAIHMAR